MLPSLTFTTRRLPPRRLVAGTAGAGLLVAALASALLTAAPSAADPSAPQPLRDRLAPSTWALALPVSWLEAPMADVRRGDSVDLLAVRGGDRPIAIPIAADLLVMEASDRAVVFQVDEDSATAIATAHASSALLVPLLRSTR